MDKQAGNNAFTHSMCLNQVVFVNAAGENPALHNAAASHQQSSIGESRRGI